MKTLIANILFIVLLFSCDRISDPPLPSSFLESDGVYIVNEGNYMWGNGSISFYSYDSAKIYNDIFGKINNRILGDVPSAMKIHGENAYIIVNNSGKIEVVNKNTMESIKTITGLISPRNIAFINDNKAYITSMYSDSVTIINPADNSISGYINLRRSSESIEIVGSKAFVSQWVSGNEVMVINTSDDKLIDSVEVGIEPESMVTDKNKTLWVLCNGGWARDNFAELISVNTQSCEIQKNFIFPSRLSSPACLQINGNGDTLYYLESGLRCMSIYSQELPSSPLIAENDHFFYKIGINPANNDIFITDAADYQKMGFVIIYKRDGKISSKLQADIIPGQMCFKIDGNVFNE
jgi:hypothetical protein